LRLKIRCRSGEPKIPKFDRCASPHSCTVIPEVGVVARSAAIGSAGVPIDPGNVTIFLGEHKVSSEGGPVPYDPVDLKRILEREEVEITVHLGQGEGSAYFLTCDLTTDYVRLNAGETS